MIEKLIIDCKKNNKQAQAELYKKLSPMLYGVCLKYSKNQEEAKDNLQESFLLIFEKIGTFENKGSFEGWAKRLTINYILQQYRKKGVLFEVIHDNIPETESEVLFDEQDISMEFLVKIIQELPERYRMVFNLMVFEKYKHSEIASMLNISEGTSKSNFARAKTILQNKINNKKNIFFSKIK